MVEQKTTRDIVIEEPSRSVRPTGFPRMPVLQELVAALRRRCIFRNFTKYATRDLATHGILAHVTVARSVVEGHRAMQQVNVVREPRGRRHQAPLRALVSTWRARNPAHSWQPKCGIK